MSKLIFELNKLYPEAIVIKLKHFNMPNILIFYDTFIIGIYLIDKVPPITQYYIERLEDCNVKIIINRNVDIVLDEIKSIIQGREK